MIRQPSPQVIRKEAEVAIASALSRARGNAGLSYCAVGATCDVSKQQVFRWEDPSTDKLPRLAHLACLPRPLALDVLRVLAEMHGADVVDRIVGDSSGDDLRGLAKLSKACGDATAQIAEALADGRWDEQERREALSVLDSLSRVVAGLRTAIQRGSIHAVRQGVAS